MNKEALLKLAELHENFEAEQKNLVFPVQPKLHMGHFYATVDERDSDELSVTVLECGTTCCSAGLASLHPWFNARGFQSKFEKVQTYDDGRIKIPVLVRYQKRPKTKFLTEWNAMEEFFDINFGSVVYLFGSHRERNHEFQAAVLRHFVETGEEMDYEEYNALEYKFSNFELV